MGVKGAHRTELAAESGLRMAYHRHKTAPYRKVSKLQRKAAAAEAQVAYQQVLQAHPELEKNHLSRLWQKKKLQRQYAKAARDAQKTGQRVKDTAVTTEKIAKRVVESVKRHPVAWGIVGLLLLLIFLIASVFASFSNIGTAGLNVITASSYLAEDVDLNTAELTYTEWETNLEIEIRNVESARPGYDEYRYQIDAIEHDHYILMSYLTAVYQDFTYASVQGALRQLFESQYTLTYTEETEIRYRTETFTDPETDESGSNSDYLALLPESSQRGLMLTALYGWQPGAELPISGINADDWKMATQCILWEYQQQLRSDPYSLHDNYLVTADQYYKIIAGRPAEKAYNWILEQIAKHSEIPSFTGATEGSAPTLELKWDSAAKVYTLTVTDTNGLNKDLELLSGSGISVTRNGSSYTFTSRNMISDPITFTFRKNIPVADEMLIWGRPGYQTMLTGASDPVTFAVKIKTETYGKAQIVKTSEDGIVSGIPFHISGNGVEMDVTTGADGTIFADLLPGVYLVSELPVDRYVTPASQHITVESGATSTVHFSNVLKKFRIHAVKKDATTGTAQGDATLAGAVYGLYLNGELVDTYTTGPDAEFTTRYYACGDSWTMREIQPSTGYLLNDTVYEVGSSPSLYEVELNTTENTVSETVISGSIRIVKHTDEIDPDVQGKPIPQAAETDELIGLTGTRFRIRNVETGEYITQEVYYPNPQTLDVFYVSDEGWLMLPEPLPVGEFELIEVSAPFGYVLSSEPIFFTVDGSEETVTVVQYNAPQKGRITISKQGEVFASVMENAGLYQPMYQVMGLPGAVYDVIADEDIYTGDGTLRVTKDTVVETLTTGDDSTATTDLLYLDRYRLEERIAPAGMVLNETP